MLAQRTSVALPQRQRVERERQTVNQGVPPVRFAVLYGVQVALNHPFVPERTELLQLPPSHAAAGGGEIAQRRFARNLAVDFNQLAQGMTDGNGVTFASRGFRSTPASSCRPSSAG